MWREGTGGSSKKPKSGEQAEGDKQGIPLLPGESGDAGGEGEQPGPGGEEEQGAQDNAQTGSLRFDLRSWILF